jgi:hypothetical protein
MIISILILTNILTGIALVSHICESVHDREMKEQAKQNIRNATTALDTEWKRLEREMAKNRKLNREIAAMGGNRIKDYLGE